MSQDKHDDPQVAKVQKRERWQWWVHFFSNNLSDALNIGIVLKLVAEWWPKLLILGGGFIDWLAIITTPAIYVVKAIGRWIKAAARGVFGVTFHGEEDNQLSAKTQTLLDVAASTIFVAVATLIAGIAGTLGATIGWALAVPGLFIVWYTDYYLPAKQAKKEFNTAQTTLSNTDPAQISAADIHARDVAYHAYLNKLDSRNLYFKLVFIICGSLFAIALSTAVPLLAPVLVPIAKVLSIALVYVNLRRFANWLAKPKEIVGLEQPDASAKQIEDDDITLVVETYNKQFHWYNRRSSASVELVGKKDNNDQKSMVNEYLADKDNIDKRLYRLFKRSQKLAGLNIEHVKSAVAAYQKTLDGPFRKKSGASHAILQAVKKLNNKHYSVDEATVIQKAKAYLLDSNNDERTLFKLLIAEMTSTKADDNAAVINSSISLEEERSIGSPRPG